jgi:hypothetical protein
MPIRSTCSRFPRCPAPDRPGQLYGASAKIVDGGLLSDRIPACRSGRPGVSLLGGCTISDEAFQLTIESAERLDCARRHDRVDTIPTRQRVNPRADRAMHSLARRDRRSPSSWPGASGDGLGRRFPTIGGWLDRSSAPPIAGLRPGFGTSRRLTVNFRKVLGAPRPHLPHNPSRGTGGIRCRPALVSQGPRPRTGPRRRHHPRKSIDRMAGDRGSKDLPISTLSAGLRVLDEGHCHFFRLNSYRIPVLSRS